MKYLLTTLILLYAVNPSLVMAKVYKCKDQGGKTVYKSQPCDAKSQIELKTRIKSEQPGETQASDSPIGRWVNEKKPKMTASLSFGGSFSMTDHEGTPLRGKWSGDKGSYKIEASFQGIDMGIKMRYIADTDTLLLSKPGFASSMVAYKRR